MLHTFPVASHSSPFLRHTLPEWPCVSQAPSTSLAATAGELCTAATNATSQWKGLQRNCYLYALSLHRFCRSALHLVLVLAATWTTRQVLVLLCCLGVTSLPLFACLRGKWEQNGCGHTAFTLQKHASKSGCFPLSPSLQCPPSMQSRRLPARRSPPALLFFLLRLPRRPAPVSHLRLGRFKRAAASQKLVRSDSQTLSGSSQRHVTSSGAAWIPTSVFGRCMASCRHAGKPSMRLVARAFTRARQRLYEAGHAL